MAKLYVDTIEPEGATTNLAIGEAGQDVILPGNDIRANVLQDAGGNALFTSNGSGTLSGVSSGFGGPIALISTQTASGDSEISFTSGITSTFNHYIFKFYNVAPATDSVDFTFQGNSAGGSGYNETITSTYFRSFNTEGNTDNGLAYLSNGAQNEGTSYQILARELGNAADESLAGELHLFNPSSTTYIKNFYSDVSVYRQDNYAMQLFVSGYFNTVLAIDEIQFKMASGDFDGTIKMLGVKQ